jgi:hypothetical protein
MPRSFEIRDRFGRNWGTFVANHDDGAEIHGRLSPGADFEKVLEVFARHDEAFDNGSTSLEGSADAIANLGAYLIDLETRHEYDVGGRIFVNRELLVSCELGRMR